MSRRESRDEYDRLCRMISRWNDRRVELFEISMPNDRLEFEGVMKFYFQYQDDQGQKVATKCIRVSNTATVQDVIEVLVQKFRPDLRMLPNLTSYALYEVHNNEVERRMDHFEKPLLTMLKWSAKDIDGRFLLRNELKMQFSLHSKLIQGKKSPQTKKKKSPKIDRRKNRYMTRTPTDITDSSDVDSEKGRIARSLYTDYPPSRFTRSITNPDIVKTHWTSGGNRRIKIPIQEGMSDSTIPISMETLTGDIPSKSILATKSDTAVQLVRSAVEKFGLTNDPEDYCLVQVTIPLLEGSVEHLNVQERILDNNENPVKIHKSCTTDDSRHCNIVHFHLRRRDSFCERFKFPSIDLSMRHDSTMVPVLIEIPDTSSDMYETSHAPYRYPLSSVSTEIGSHSSALDPVDHICLTYHGIRPRHCVITKSNSSVYSITLLDPTALVKVNDSVVTDTQLLAPDSVLLLGDNQMFRFVTPASFHVRSNSALPVCPTYEPHEVVLSKAFSSDDLGHSMHVKGRKLDSTSSHMKNRTVSEHTLKGEGSTNEMIDDDNVMPDEDSNITSVTTSRIVKKRHNSASQQPVLNENELAVLPAALVFHQSNENYLLQVLVSNIDGFTLQFKLAPAYAIYMIARHHISSDFIPEPNRHQSLIHMLKYTCSLIKRTVKESKNIAGVLAFWLSNTSELLHFLRRDYRLYMFAHEYENTLTSIIHMTYKHFTEYMVREISIFLPAFLSESSEVDSEECIGYYPGEPTRETETSQEPDIVAVSHSSLTSIYWSRSDVKVTRKGVGGVLSTLNATVSLLHLCKVNNTLSILIFNLLFRYISMRLFNKLIMEPRYCTKTIGQKLLRRLEKLKTWADKENMRLPAEEHLGIVIQAAKLIVASSDDIKDVDHFYTSLSQLNSNQMKTLLHNIENLDGRTISPDVASKLISMAYDSIDQKLLTDGQEVPFQEDPNLELPFLIPEHGYSCDTMRGVPVGLEEYLDTASSASLCQLIVTKDSLGCWVPPRITTSKQRESPVSTQASTQMSQTLPKNFPHNPYAAMAEQKSHRPKSSMDVPTDSLYSLDDINIIIVTLNKGVNKSLGISICESRDPRGTGIGIFIKSLSRGGPAYQDGRLHPGDQILQIDNTSLNGYNRDLVGKLLRSSHSQVTITVATNVAQLFQLNEVFQTSPRLSNKLPQSEVVPPPKEGSSHAMKAARRELRRQQQTPNRSYDQYQPHVISPVPQIPTLMSKWLQEQREINQQKPSGYQRISVPHNIATSLSSLVPEREEPALPTLPSELMSDSSINHYHVTTPSGTDISDNQRNIRAPYSKLTLPSKQDDTSHLRSRTDFTSFNETGFAKYHSNDPLSPDLSLANSSQTPYKDVSSLSGHQSDLDTSQAYPSLAREKLSMEVGYHTQLSSTGLSVSSVLDQLSRKGKKGDHGLQVSELQSLEVDEIQLEKQRMQLLFYRQQKEKKEQELSSTLVEHQMPQQENVSMKWSTKEQEDEDELLMNPEKLLLIARVKQELDSVRRLMNDQRKRCRELQFAKEREEQSLSEAETRFKPQNRHFMPFMRPEDESRWQRDQKRKLKEWERLCSEKKEELHQIEVKEMQAKARLRALEQHASDLKKQLLICESKQVPSREVPEKDWTERSRPLRVMSTDSITTGSSWLSNENISKDTISIGSEYNIADYHVSGTRSPPLGCHSDSSSPGPFSTRWPPRLPELHGSTEIPTLMHNPDIAHNIKRAEYSEVRESSMSHEQEERLRVLKEEHNHHLSSLESIPSRSAKDKAIQLHQLKKEVHYLHDIPDYQTTDLSLRQSSSAHSPMRPSVGSGGYDSRESSLSSSTPDVVPLMFTLPTKVPHQQVTASSFTIDSLPNYQNTFQQSLLRSRSRDEISELRKQDEPLLDESLSGGHRYQLLDQDRANRKVPKTGGPHSYSRGRPEPPSNEERGRLYREKGSATSQNSLPGSSYVQRQQTEL